MDETEIKTLLRGEWATRREGSGVTPSLADLFRRSRCIAPYHAISRHIAAVSRPYSTVSRHIAPYRAMCQPADSRRSDLPRLVTRMGFNVVRLIMVPRCHSSQENVLHSSGPANPRPSHGCAVRTEMRKRCWTPPSGALR